MRFFRNGGRSQTNSYGGGGGGGYFGGGGGGGAYSESNTMGGGGGGSGYVANQVVFGATFTGSQQSPACWWDPDLSTLTDANQNSGKIAHGGDCAYIVAQYTASYGGGGGGLCVIKNESFSWTLKKES